jgi:hypothetical protein
MEYVMSPKEKPPVKIFEYIGGVQYSPDDLDKTNADSKFADAWAVDEDNVVFVDWDKARALFRETATLSKQDFCFALAKKGILSAEDAIEAAKGNWPAAFEDALAGADADEALKAKIEWASTATVYRSYPTLEPLAIAANITSNDLDLMFGYTGQ